MYQVIKTLLFLVGILSMSNLYATTTHPVLKIYEQFHTIKEENAISPYIVSIYAIDLLENGDHNEIVSDFILWYTTHANKLDCFGVSGTIYDYVIDKNGTEHPLKTYDSADGYAGMYLYLVTKYYQKTKDRTLLNKIWSTIEDNIYLILYLQDKDGLTKALAHKNYEIKYLMDNVESFLGVKSYLYLVNELNKPALKYEGLRDTLKNAILTELYNKKTKTFYWAKENNTYSEVNNSIYYPDLFSKIHLLAFWGEEIDEDMRTKLWKDIIHFYTYSTANTSMEQMIIFNWAKNFSLKNINKDRK